MNRYGDLVVISFRYKKNVQVKLSACLWGCKVSLHKWVEWNWTGLSSTADLCKLLVKPSSSANIEPQNGPLPPLASTPSTQTSLLICIFGFKMSCLIFHCACFSTTTSPLLYALSHLKCTDCIQKYVCRKGSKEGPLDADSTYNGWIVGRKLGTAISRWRPWWSGVWRRWNDKT